MNIADITFDQLKKDLPGIGIDTYEKLLGFFAAAAVQVQAAAADAAVQAAIANRDATLTELNNEIATKAKAAQEARAAAAGAATNVPAVVPAA